MSYLYTAAASRAIDARAIDTLDVSGYELMQRAARFATDQIVTFWPDARSLSVVCGKGNNAGDAYLVAAEAKNMGLTVQVLPIADPGDLRGDAALAFGAAQAAVADPVAVRVQ